MSLSPSPSVSVPVSVPAPSTHAAEHDGQELAVGDVLQLGAHHAAGLLEELLVGPVPVHLGQRQRCRQTTVVTAGLQRP